MPWKPPVHKPAHCIRARSEHRPSAARRGYGYRWQKYVKWFVMNNPLCVRCLKEGVTRATTDVDHITPVTGPDDPLFWEPSNHQPLCGRHHKAKTASEDRGKGRGFRGGGGLAG